jgi:hypothetical protein
MQRFLLFSNLREIFRQEDKLSLVLHGLSFVAMHVDISLADPQCGRFPILICLTLGVAKLLRL